MFSFFKKNKKQPTDYAFLHTDMHSHLIPGIDDGAKTISESIEIIRGLKDVGFQKIITTPHIFSSYYPNTPDIIRTGLAELKAALLKAEVAIDIEAAAEYFIDDFFEDLLNKEAPLLSFSDNRLLIELSTFAEPTRLHDIIFQLNILGYKPILAHPERYLYFSDRFEEFEKIKSLGCSMQVNLLSLNGHYGKPQKKLGIKLIKSGLIDYLGTDIHRTSQLEALYQDLEITKLIKKMDFLNDQL